MPEASDRPADDDPFVYGVRPEPPHFEELIRRPDPADPYVWGLQPPGPIRRRVGARRSRLLFQIALVIVMAVAVAALLG